MQKLIESYSEFKLGERNVTKHFNLLDAIRTKITDDDLYTVSELEQDTCSSQSDDKTGVFNRIRALLENSKIRIEQKVRLVLVFCLRYEGDLLCHQLKEKLRNVGAGTELGIINQMIEYAGKDKRRGDLFAKQDFLKKSKTLLNNVFMLETEQNVFLQHKPFVTQIVDQLLKGRLSQHQYISTQPFDFKVPAKRVIVFIVGGATYVEAKELESLNNVVLGSTNLINSKQFLD